MLAQYPDEPYVHILGAYITCLSGKHAMAVQQMARILRVLPDSPELISYYALLLEANDDFERAIELYEHALTLTPYPPNWIRTNLGLAYLLVNHPNAENTLDMALAFDEKSVRAHVGKIAALARRNRPYEARAWAKSLRRLQRDFSAKSWRNLKFFKNPVPMQKITEELRRSGL